MCYPETSIQNHNNFEGKHMFKTLEVLQNKHIYENRNTTYIRNLTTYKQITYWS